MLKNINKKREKGMAYILPIVESDDDDYNY